MDRPGATAANIKATIVVLMAIFICPGPLVMSRRSVIRRYLEYSDRYDLRQGKGRHLFWHRERGYWL
jgi:hypothetical protein